MRSPAEMDILQIDLGTACHLKCANCTRGVGHFKKNWALTPEEFRTAIASLDGWWEPGKVIGLIGGEPTLNPHFEEIVRIFVEMFGPKEPFTNGRLPIANFAEYATERLFDRTGGRGLWSTPGPTYYKHFEIIQDAFAHQNLNDHFHPGLHKAVLITRREMGISDEEWIPMRDACWVQNTWSASIRQNRSYFCEVAGTIDDLYFKGKHGLPVEQGWWKRKPNQFITKDGLDQRSLCEFCACAIPNAPSAQANNEIDLVSPIHRELLEAVGSPKLKRGDVEVYQIGDIRKPGSAVIEDEREHRKNRYMEDEGRRVSPDNNTIKPQKLSCVVVSVNYGGLLNQTIYRNIEHFDEFVVVTHPDDIVSQNIARDAGATVILSSRCYDDDHAFNKGRMLNDGLAALKNPDWILFTDADILLHENTGTFIRSHVLNPGCLYYTRRQDGYDGGPVDGLPNGFFQLWNKRSLTVRDRWPNVLCENFCSAGSVDTWFFQQWEPSKMIGIREIPVTHIPHGEFAAKWNGEKRPGWRQFGWLTRHGVEAFDCMKGVPTPTKVRLTDTRYGLQADVDLSQPQDVVVPHEGGLMFLGKDIEECHVHVAYWSE